MTQPAPHQGFIANLKLGFKFARRELRSGLQGFWIFLTCLILGVGAIAIIGTLSVSIQRGMTEQGQPLLGGDLEFSVIHRQLGDREAGFVAKLGQISRVATMRGIAITQNKAQNTENGTTSQRALVEVKAVDNVYPLYGDLTLKAQGAFQPRLAKSSDNQGDLWGAFAESSILARLKIKPGSIITMGKARFIIHDIISREPDRIADGLILGPRLMISHDALKATGLVKPGSLVRWRYRVKLADTNADLAAIEKTATEQFPDAGWRIRSRNAAAPGAERFLNRLTFFLSLTGLTALVVGGAGLGNAVRTFMQRRKNNIATLKCLGASSQVILATYLIEIMLLALLGITLGLLLGAGLPLIAMPFMQNLLPVPIAPAVEIMPLLQAGAFGFLVTIAFSLWPLSQAKDTPASELFRGSIGQNLKRPSAGFLIAILTAVALIIILALFAFPNRYITGWYLVGISLSFIVLTALSRLIMWAAKRFSHLYRPAARRAVSRLAIANLYRPGAPTPSIVLALGLGLSLFVTIALVDQNVSKELQSAVPAQAPSFFFLDIQNNQLETFKSFADGQKGVSKTGSAPMLRGRVQKLNGVALKDVSIAPDVAWAFRGDRGITYSASLPEGSKITAGQWWQKDYDGPPLVSFVEEIAHGAGLKIGDSVTVNILGRSVTAKIASLRAVEWESLRINFVMVFSPGTLKGAPHTHLVTVTMDNARQHEDQLLAAVSEKFKAVTAIRIKDALDAVNALLGQLLLAIRAASSITMITGILVLAGALASGLATRTYDAVVLKTFGATRSQLIQAFIYEYALLGLITAVFSIFIGASAAYAIIHFIMEMPWRFSLTTAIATALFAMLLTIAAGLTTTWRALTAKPARILRTE